MEALVIYLRVRRTLLREDELRSAVDLVFSIVARATILDFSLNGESHRLQLKASLATLISEFWFALIGQFQGLAKLN